MGGYPPASNQMVSAPADLQQGSNVGGYPPAPGQMGSGPAGLQGTAGPSGHPLAGKPPKAKKEKSKKHRHLVDEGGEASMSSGKPASGSVSEHKHKKHKHKKRHQAHGRMMAAGSASLASDSGGPALAPGAQPPAPAAAAAGDAAGPQPPAPAAAAAAAAAGPAAAGPMLHAPGASSQGLPAASHVPQAQQPVPMRLAQVALPDSNPEPPSQAGPDPLGHVQHQQGAPHEDPPQTGAGSLRAPAPVQASTPPMEQPGILFLDAAPAPEPSRDNHRNPADQARSQTQAGMEGRHGAVALTGASMQPAADDGHSAAAGQSGVGMACAQGGDAQAPSSMQQAALGGNASEAEGRSTAERTTEGDAAEEGPDAVRRQESEGHGAGPLAAAGTPREGSGAYLQDLDQESLPPKKKRHKGFTIKLGGRTL